ncbi:MAG: transketolase [Dehalococcoidia bacterium]|nr:transketolase [Dehalococcoidia bacterium]MDH4299520.1 transketolase [Dehalococcoidia bacterium]
MPKRASVRNTPPSNGFNLSTAELKEMAKKLRRHVISMIAAAGSGHPGGSLSAADIITALYFKILRHDPDNPQWSERDRFILSKGHAAPILYAALAEAGYFPVAELETLRKMDSRLQGHTDRNLTPGVEMSAGSLGIGLSYAIGVALAARLDSKTYRTYALLSDGECEEGQTWEAALAAAHFNLDNLTAIVDCNDMQLSGWVRQIMNLEPLVRKWQAFGWHVINVDGHDFDQILAAFPEAEKMKGKPTVITARTIKGKGVSFMENNVGFHGKAPTQEEAEKALKELE